jgi:class 3 adenylate cyclase
MALQAKTRSRLATTVSVLALAAAISALCLLAVQFAAPLRQAAQWLDDLRLAYLTLPVAQNADVVVLAIDEDTLKLMPYRSPIDREFIADVVRSILAGYDVRAIGIDVIFDQPTVPEKDARLKSALAAADVPVVVATGERETGLNPDQLAFQDDYLEGIRTGSAMLSIVGGSVRNYHPFIPGSGAGSFVHAIATAAGIASPQEPVPILYRRVALGDARPIRVFPAHALDLLPKAWLDGRIVLIGADLADRDQHRTPLSILGGSHEFTPGVLIHAQTLAQIASGAALPTLPDSGESAIVVVAVLAGLCLVLLPMPGIVRLLVGALVLGGYWLAGFSADVYAAMPLPLVGPSIGFGLAAGAATAMARQQERRLRLFLHGAFNQYVSAQIIDDIIENPEHLKLGGDLRDMSFMFTDIADFSTMAEHLAPEKLVELLTDYLDGVVEIALRHRGTIARFVGDGFVIFFGAPVADAEHRRQAVQCATDIDRFCETYRRLEQYAEYAFGITRIGVHSGRAVVGNVGGRRRFEYTAQGDAINTAARLESANRHLGTRVCISRDTAQAMPGSDFRPIGNVIVKGRSAPLTLVTLWDGMDMDERNDYLDAWQRMHDRDPSALERMAALAKKRPDDRLVALHFSRLRNGETGITFGLGEK